LPCSGHDLTFANFAKSYLFGCDTYNLANYAPFRKTGEFQLAVRARVGFRGKDGQKYKKRETKNQTFKFPLPPFCFAKIQNQEKFSFPFLKKNLGARHQKM
jgi:hypothetical protein